MCFIIPNATKSLQKITPLVFLINNNKTTIMQTTYSWANISKTANKTDTQLVEMFKKTALYSTIRDELRRAGATLEIEEISTANVLLPVEEASRLPTREELESRWPGHADEQIDALIQDYVKEKERLESVELEAIVNRIKELVIQEVTEEGEEIEMQM